MSRVARRIVAGLLLAAAVAMAVPVIRQIRASDDGGPPLGAVCVALPSLVLLIAAGVVWQGKPRRRG